MNNDPKLDAETIARLSKTHSGRDALKVIEDLRALLAEARSDLELREEIRLGRRPDLWICLAGNVHSVSTPCCAC